MSRDSTKAALNKYFAKQLSSNKPKRTNQTPEKDLEKLVMLWLRQNNWKAWVVESKAVFSKAAGRFLRGSAQAGFPDMCGLNERGLFVAIELKSPGRRSTLREAQRAFLLEVIDSNGFACCIDSVDLLEKTYREFCHSPSPKAFLVSQLPTPSMRADNSPLFDDV